MLIQIPSRFSVGIAVGVWYGMRGIDCVSSEDNVCRESKTDTGHRCGMYMWFVDLYIGKIDTCLTFAIRPTCFYIEYKLNVLAVACTSFNLRISNKFYKLQAIIIMGVSLQWIV